MLLLIISIILLIYKSCFSYEHIDYKNHECRVPDAHGLQVPFCPLCNLSYSRGLYGNLEIAAIIHVEQECESPLATARRKVGFYFQFLLYY